MKKILLLTFFLSIPLSAQTQIGQCERFQGRVIRFLNSVKKVHYLAKDNYDEAIVSQAPCFYLYESKELIWEAQRLIIEEGGYFIKGMRLNCSDKLASMVEKDIDGAYRDAEMLESDIDEELNNPLNYCR